MKVSDLLACVNEGNQAIRKLSAYARSLEKAGLSSEVPLTACESIGQNVWRIMDAEVEIKPL